MEKQDIITKAIVVGVNHTTDELFNYQLQELIALCEARDIEVVDSVVSKRLPKELTDKCTVLNNSSLLGTVKYATEKNMLFTNNIRYVDLSAHPVFSDLFIENMMF